MGYTLTPLAVKSFNDVAVVHYTPVPDSDTDFFEAPPPGVMMTFADLLPNDVGLKTTVIVQAVPTAISLPQSFD